jgi:hypothetical protein
MLIVDVSVVKLTAGEAKQNLPRKHGLLIDWGEKSLM